MDPDIDVCARCVLNVLRAHCPDAPELAHRTAAAAVLRVTFPAVPVYVIALRVERATTPEDENAT